jgi:hypothetical protein
MRPLRASLADSRKMSAHVRFPRSGNTQAGGSVDEGLANLFNVKDSGGLDIVPTKWSENGQGEKMAGDIPIFSCVWVGNLLLTTLLSLRKTLVLTNSLCIG